MLVRLNQLTNDIRSAVRGLSDEQLTRRDGEKWSIQEHIGHLIDLDELHYNRLDDFESGARDLRPADLKNQKTWDAHYNERNIDDLLPTLQRERSRFTERLAGYSEDFLNRSAIHPRLQQPMRVIDLVEFVVEHDAHHLAWIEALAAESRPKAS